jgi:hypothetical protein
MSPLLAFLMTLVTLPVTQSPDYAGVYARGMPYAAFLEGVTARADDWRRNSSAAVVEGAASDQVGRLAAKRKLLVITEASCSDSVGTVPYLARLVELAPGRLEMRLVNSKVGRAVMEAHRTPDGRAATPTVIVLDEDGGFVGAWVERPAELQKWHIEQQATASSRQLLPQKMKWYADDAGRSTIAEVLALATRDAKQAH